MPSPIAHLTAGYIIYRLSRNYEPHPRIRHHKWGSGLRWLAGGFSLLPDVDSAVGVLLQDFARYHNNASHSLLIGIVVALGFAVVMKWRTNNFAFWFLFALACYNLHILMDATTWSRGAMLLWPFSEQRFRSPVLLFYGLHWSNGLWSSKHLVTLVSELAFAAVVLFPWWARSRRVQVRL